MKVEITKKTLIQWYTFQLLSWYTFRLLSTDYERDPGYELFVAIRNGKYGVLSNKGEVIIDFRYMEIYYTGWYLCLEWWDNDWTDENIDDDKLGEYHKKLLDLEELIKKWENSNRKPIIISD